MAPSIKTSLTFKSFLEVREGSDHWTGPYENLGPRVNIVSWFLTGLAIVFLGLRLYCKRIRQKKLWWDDYMLVAASIALVTQTSLLSYYVHLGFGKHSRDIKNWRAYLYFANITGVCSIVAAALSKTSFALTLLRLSSTKWLRWLVWFIIASVNIFLGLSCIFTYVQCTPVERLWNHSIEGTCWPHKVIITYNSFSSGWSGVMDILLALLPWWMISLPLLNRKERLGVLIAMSMGSVAGLTSIAKIYFLRTIQNPDAISSVCLMILATAESAITIIAASIPILRILVRNTMQSRFPHRSTATYDSRKAPMPLNTAGFELLQTPSPVFTPLQLKGFDFQIKSFEGNMR